MSIREHLLYRHRLPQADITGLPFRDVVSLHRDLHAEGDSTHRVEYQGWTHEDVKAAGVELEEPDDSGVTTKIEAPTMTERVDAVMRNPEYVFAAVNSPERSTEELPPGTQRIQFTMPRGKASDLHEHGPHGEHYAAMGLQPIDVIEAWGLGFNLGSVLKYLARPKGQTIADLEKAVWYLQRELDNRRGAAL